MNKELLINKLEECGFSSDLPYENMWKKKIINHECVYKSMEPIEIGAHIKESIVEKCIEMELYGKVCRIPFEIEYSRFSFLKRIDFNVIVDILMKLNNISSGLEKFYDAAYWTLFGIDSLSHASSECCLNPCNSYLPGTPIKYVIAPLRKNHIGTFYFQGKAYSFNELELFYKKCLETKPDLFLNPFINPYARIKRGIKI